MDEARRAALYARRQAVLTESAARDRRKDRAAFVAMVPILTALEAAGDDYDSDSYRGLHGRLNQWAHDPSRYGMREQSYAKLPADTALRDAMILERLRQKLSDDALVTIILRREAMMLTMRMPVLVRHLETLFESAKGDRLGFTAPPAEWIVATFHVDPLELSEIVTGTLED
ncbi:MAG: hypothetical protein V4808_01545 [Pseudomonadota bacterium]